MRHDRNVLGCSNLSNIWELWIINDVTDPLRECDLSLSLPSCHGLKMENFKTRKNNLFLPIKEIYFLLLIDEKKFF